MFNYLVLSVFLRPVLTNFFLLVASLTETLSLFINLLHIYWAPILYLSTSKVSLSHVAYIGDIYISPATTEILLLFYMDFIVFYFLLIL